MQRVRVTCKTTFDKESDLEIKDFIDNLKESFENVVIISIENLPKKYSKFYAYEYRVCFYHDLYVII